MKIDPPIEEVRELRARISARFENDPAPLVEYYIKLQKQYRERLIDQNEETTDIDHIAA